MKNFWLIMLLACAAGAQTVENAAGAKLRLDEVVRLALERSPEMQSAQAAIRASGYRVAQARALPDPVVTVGWAGKAAPLVTMPGDPSSYRGITVSEQFPYPGKLRLQGQIATRESQAAEAECEAVRRRIVLEATTAYAEYFYLDQALAAARENKDLLERVAGIAEAQYRVGKAMQQDVLRAQVEISMLAEKIELLEQQRLTAVAEINAALQQAPETLLPPAEALEARPLRYSLEELYALAGANDAGIERSQAMIARGKLAVALAARQSRPDIGVSYMFQQRTNQPDMNGVSVSINLPVFWKSKQRAALSEAVETLHGAEQMQEAQRNTVRAQVRRDQLAATAAAHLLELYNQAIVPQSSLALESAMSAYQVGKIDFLSLAASLTTLLNYQTDTYRQLADYQTAVARLESLTGEAIAVEAHRAESTASVEKGGR